MSIIKSILHKYNATSKAYDTLHPETESAQVTDWNQGIVNTLASTALGGLVNTLTSDSLLAKMIQKVLTATGVRYNIDQNGYICFGSLFGGLIIQWGTGGENIAAKSMTVKLPISARIYQVFLTDSSLEGNSAFDFTMCWDRDHVGANVSSFNVKSTVSPSSFSWLFVGNAN